jgi:hypothetical protein
MFETKAFYSIILMTSLNKLNIANFLLCLLILYIQINISCLHITIYCHFKIFVGLLKDHILDVFVFLYFMLDFYIFDLIRAKIKYKIFLINNNLAKNIM